MRNQMTTIAAEKYSRTYSQPIMTIAPDLSKVSELKSESRDEALAFLPLLSGPAS